MSAKEQIDQSRKNWCPNVSMVPEHRVLLDFAQHPIPKDKFISLTPLSDEARDFRKVVAAVGIAHHDEYT